MGISHLTLAEVCNYCGTQDGEFYIEMTQFFNDQKHLKDILGNKKTTRIKKPGIIFEEDVTILDLFKIPFGSDEEIIIFILDRMKIDIRTSEGIQKINSLFSEAIRLYKKRYLKTIGNIENTVFKSTNGILEFLRDTKKNKKNGVIKCAIAKIGFSVNDILSSEKIEEVENLDDQFVDQHLGRPFQIDTEKSYEDKNGNKYRIGKAIVSGRVIPFKFISRQKGLESLMGKEISDPTYYTVDKFGDLVGATIYVETAEEAIVLMQYIDQMVYKGKGKIKNKNGITGIDLTNASSALNKEFYEKALKVINSEVSNKDNGKGTPEDYKDIKLVGDVNLRREKSPSSSPVPIGTEVKFVIGGHDNEKGIRLHAIYDYIKRFRELTRLGIPIREIDVVRFVNDFFDNLDDILKRKNKDRDTYIRELVEDFVDKGYLYSPNEEDAPRGLYNHFIKQLVKVEVQDSKEKKVFFFDERALRLRDLGMHRQDLQVYDLQKAA